ncbi:tetratricopeptide repeat protein [Nocardia transvalensis]|uniref:tetratricopeptide repeat protein n=1 Tax=Nocardia transvalensis TaxID=37333 RepID=UPI0018950E79|nr:tetratricopeptide repeat protein [Nocardia transvalensis]MBF6329514.1 hypothetical protein [Nocardia transvalensis]
MIVDVDRALARADAAVHLGRLDEARRIVGTALVGAPEDAALLERMADIAYRLDEFDEALRMAGAALAADPDRTDAHLTAALAFEVKGRTESALRHARLAAALAPHDTGVLLTTAGILARSRNKTKETEAQARDMVERAAALAPGSPGVHASAARVYLRLAESESARRHVDAGLATDPADADLLTLRARLTYDLSFGFGRIKAVAVLRGVLATSPVHTEARRLLAAITWRALMRLATWVWAYVAAVVIASSWMSGGALRAVGHVVFWAIPLAWFGVFRKLRRQLPQGYLRRRLLKRPEALLALLVLIVAALIADIGAALLYLRPMPASVRGGYVLLVVAVLGAVFGHLLLFGAWMRRCAGEEDREACSDYALFGFVVIGGAAVLIGGPLAAVAYWSHQPVAMWALLAIVCALLLTMIVEAIPATVLSLGRPDWWVYVVLAVIVVLLLAGFWWGTHHLLHDTLH